MANRPRLGHEGYRVTARHGRQGNALLRADVPPELKTRVVTRAAAERITIKQLIVRALEHELRKRA